MIKLRRFYQTITVLSLFPVLLWILIRPISDRFINIGVTTTSFGQLAGLVGYCLFALTIILSSRSKWIEKRFTGLDQVYREHHFLGQLTLILLTLHPILLSIKYIQASAESAMNFFMPSLDSLPRSLGTISLDLMIIVIFFTLYCSLRYHVWKQTHRLTTAAFIVGFIHTLLIYSDTSQSLVLKAYLIVIGALAIIIGLARLLGTLTIKKTPAVVVGVKNQGAVNLIALRPNKKFSFSAGQFAFLRFEGELRESHPFSFMTGSNEQDIVFGIKKLGDYTNRLENLKPGAKAVIEGPYGGFTQNKVTTSKQLWIAGGIGITPFFSLLKDLPESIQTDLIWSVGSKEEAFSLNTIDSVTKPNFTFSLFESSSNGYLDINKIRQLTKFTPEDTTVMLCGPTPMMKSLKKQLIQAGVSEERIIFEDFAL